MSEDSIKISNRIMRILFEWGLYSNADSICDFTVSIWNQNSNTGIYGKWCSHLSIIIFTTSYMKDP